MANTDWAFGFAPYDMIYPGHYYAVETAPTINIYHNDIVGVDGAHYSTPMMGYLPGILVDNVCDGLDNLLGSVQAIFDENFDPVRYIAAGDTGNGTIAGYVYVLDHPMQLYVAREDFAGNAIDIAEGSLNADIVSVALSAGNSNTGISRQMIDSDSVAGTAALNLKLMGPHPNDVSLVADDTPGSSGDEGARWICRITEHYYGQPSVDGGLSA